MQTSDRGRKLNAQNTGGQDGQRAKLVTRLADDRRGAFAAASAAGVHEDASRVVRFGPVTDGRGFYLLDKDFAHAFVVPEQVRALEQSLAEYPAERHADVLSYFAAQHASRDRASGAFELFGQMPSSLAGRALSDQGIESAWDIRVLDENGQVSELLQAKATESVGYVKEVLLRYPDMDVTTTTEVHAQLLALALAENVRNSGISEAVLQAKVESAAQAGDAFSASDLVPSSLGLAVIALSVFLNKNTTGREKGADFGARPTKAGAFSVVGKVAMAATQTWWIGLVAGVGSGWLASKGHGKRERYEALRIALGVMKRLLLLLLPARA